MITTAVKQAEDKAVHVSEVQRGLACGCVCADCGGKLVARQGPQRDHHFAHYTQTNCRGETNLHKMAKQILIDELCLTVGHPELDSPVMQRFETASDEVTRGRGHGRVQIDCLMEIGNEKNKLPIDITELAVEILVTHAVDEQKQTKLRELGLQTIEIDLTELAHPDSAPSKEDIRKAICDTPSNITWIGYEASQSKQLELDLDREGEGPTAERPCPDCGAELSEEASVCMSCGTVQDETAVQLSENRPEPSPEGVGPETRQITGPQNRRGIRIIKQYLETGGLAADGAIPGKQYGKTAKPKRAVKSTSRKKRKR